MNVVETAPMPHVSTPSFPFGSAMFVGRRISLPSLLWREAPVRPSATFSWRSCRAQLIVAALAEQAGSLRAFGSRASKGQYHAKSGKELQ